MEKRLVFFKVSCGVGMDSTDVYDCAGMSDEELDDLAWNLAIQNAEAFGSYYELDEIPEDDEDDIFGGDRNFTSDDLDYYWEDYVPEEHDQLRAGGGSFLDETRFKD